MRKSTSTNCPRPMASSREQHSFNGSATGSLWRASACHDFSVGGRARLPDDVHVELEMLLQPAPLLPLVAEQLRDGEPANRLLERLGPRPYHPGQGGRHLGPQRDLTPAPVLEGVQLLHELLAALLRVQLQGLERWPVVLLKAVTPCHVAPGGEDVVAESEFFRIGIAKTG